MSRVVKPLGRSDVRSPFFKEAWKANSGVAVLYISTQQGMPSFKLYFGTKPWDTMRVFVSELGEQLSATGH